MQYRAVSAKTRFMLRLLVSKLLAIVTTACASVGPFGERDAQLERFAKDVKPLL